MSRRRKIIALWVIVLMISAFAISQQLASRITGKVSDTEGAPLRDVLVKATNIKTGDETTTNSDKKGKFRLLSLSPGEYKLNFSLEGYQTYVISWVCLRAEQTANLNVTLKKKASQE